HLPDQKKLHPALAALTRELTGEAKKRGYTLRVANALWGRSGQEFLPAFLKLTRDHYGAGFKQVDFAADPEEARRTINAGAEKQTATRSGTCSRRASSSATRSWCWPPRSTSRATGPASSRRTRRRRRTSPARTAPACRCR